MASPPRTSGAGSPPYPHPLPLPQSRKRTAQGLSIAPNMPSAKRRKSTLHSATSTPGGSHPLRQTSFPPEGSALDIGDRSPSIDSDITAMTGGRSVVTTGTAIKGKRGRKKKAETSIVNAKTTARPGADGTSTRGGGGDDIEEEDDDEEAGEGFVNEGEEIDKATERENLAVLVGAFNNDQSERYEAFRRVKLRKETVRKIANQTLSQSVPPAVITTINGYTKMFIGSLIERARDVQKQYAGRLPTPPPDSVPSSDSNPNLPLGMDLDAGQSSSFNSDSFSPTTIHHNSSSSSTHHNTQALAEQQPMEPLGPLLPDHFREAIRRYKKDGEAGGTGVVGLSLGLGVKGTGSARLGGRRLFG